MNRKKKILALLLLILVGSLVYSFLHAPKERHVAVLKYRPGSVATASRARRGAAPAKGAATAGGQRVHLELLDRAQERFSGFRRNIFSPIFREEVKLPPFRPLPPLPRPGKGLPPLPKPLTVGPPPPPPAPPAPPTAQQLAENELSKITFLGFLKKNGDRTVFLSYNNEILLAKKGRTLASKFQVADLTDDAITIKTLAGGREVVIPITESKGGLRTGKRTP